VNRDLTESTARGNATKLRSIVHKDHRGARKS
jgi:hypothetical protein